MDFISSSRTNYVRVTNLKEAFAIVERAQHITVSIQYKDIDEAAVKDAIERAKSTFEFRSSKNDFEIKQLLLPRSVGKFDSLTEFAIENIDRIAFLIDGDPDYFFEGEEFDDEEGDAAAELAALMCDDEILVLTNCGQEGMRYIGGYAMAYNSKGESVQICLSDIYQLAADTFDKDVNDINRAEY